MKITEIYLTNILIFLMIVTVMLSGRHLAFVREYPVDFNGTQAAIRAGFSASNASTEAHRMLSNQLITEAIKERVADIAAAADLSQEWVLRQWKMIAEADVDELISYRLECCRHCHGINHDYQWTKFEYDKAVQAAHLHQCGPKCEKPCSKLIPPLPLGGFNYDPNLEPLQSCPVCHGEGMQRIHLADTRRLKGSARRLYAGVKQTQNGIEVKMRDQDGALKNIAQYLGMLIDKRELAGPNGGPIPTANFSAKDLTDDQLAQILLQEQG